MLFIINSVDIDCAAATAWIINSDFVIVYLQKKILIYL